MARIQILELPSEEDANERFVTPFALIIDQCGDELRDALLDGGLAEFRERCGARAALVTAETIDIERPASTNIGTVSVKVVPELDEFREQVERAASDVQDRLKEVARGRFA
jgi:hypothetical protein